MNNLYIAIFEVNGHGIDERISERIDPTSVIQSGGFECQLLNFDDRFFRLKVFAENPYVTHLLYTTFENDGFIIGGEYDVPTLITTDGDGGFASVLCSYIFMLSKDRISKKVFYHALEIDADWKWTSENYRLLEKRLERAKSIAAFSELMHYVEQDDGIAALTKEMVDSTRIYHENFQSRLSPEREGKVSFQENLTLHAAWEAVTRGKHTAVLNFANPLEPGGGVLRGANAQEENLCRSSNLYKSLISENAGAFFQSNKKILSKNQFNSMFLGTDSVIYSPGVIVLKDNPNYRQGMHYNGNERYVKQCFNVDVITSGAPFFSGSGYMLPNGDLQHLFERRIRVILEAAIENSIDVLVLGAFGCGHFRNPPEVVADAFREVLLDKRYGRAFDEVIFAVKRTANDCPNIKAFKKNFFAFPKLKV